MKSFTASIHCQTDLAYVRPSIRRNRTSNQ